MARKKNAWQRVEKDGWIIRKFILERGKYVTRIRKKDEDPKITERNGKKQYKYPSTRFFRSSTNNLMQARDEFDKWFHQVLQEERQDGNKGSTTIEELFRIFLDENLEIDLKPSTYQEYSNSLFGRFLPGLKSQGISYASEIKKKHVTKLISIVGFRKRNPGKETSTRTRLKYINLMHQVFDWAVRNDYIEQYPVVFKPPKKWKDELFEEQQERVGIALNQKQAQKLLNACKSSFEITIERGNNSWEQKFQPPKYLYSIVLTALRSGLRLSNITSLRWENIDMKKGFFNISKEHMKNNKDFKEIPIHPELLYHFRWLLKQQTKEEGRAPKDDDLLIRDEIKYIHRSFSRALKQAGLEYAKDEKGREKKVRFHDLRHSFKTEIEEEAGFPQSVVKHLMGWVGSDLHARYGHKKGTEKCKRELDRLPWLIQEKDHQKTMNSA